MAPHQAFRTPHAAPRRRVGHEEQLHAGDDPRQDQEGRSSGHGGQQHPQPDPGRADSPGHCRPGRHAEPEHCGRSPYCVSVAPSSSRARNTSRTLVASPTTMKNIAPRTRAQTRLSRRIRRSPSSSAGLRPAGPFGRGPAAGPDQQGAQPHGDVAGAGDGEDQSGPAPAAEQAARGWTGHARNHDGGLHGAHGPRGAVLADDPRQQGLPGGSGHRLGRVEQERHGKQHGQIVLQVLHAQPHAGDGGGTDCGSSPPSPACGSPWCRRAGRPTGPAEPAATPSTAGTRPPARARRQAFRRRRQRFAGAASR